MTTLDECRPIFKTEILREELVDIYSEMAEYKKKLFYFDWKGRD